MEYRYYEIWSASKPSLPMVYLPIGWSAHFWRLRHDVLDLPPKRAAQNIDWVCSDDPRDRVFLATASACAVNTVVMHPWRNRCYSVHMSLTYNLRCVMTTCAMRPPKLRPSSRVKVGKPLCTPAQSRALKHPRDASTYSCEVWQDRRYK